MKKASVSEAKAALSEYLSRVKRGEEVVITERGHPVAKIIPFRTQGPSVDERRELARQGILELGKGKLSHPFKEISPVGDPEGLVLKALLEERENEN